MRYCGRGQSGILIALLPDFQTIHELLLIMFDVCHTQCCVRRWLIQIVGSECPEMNRCVKTLTIILRDRLFARRNFGMFGDGFAERG